MGGVLALVLASRLPAQGWNDPSVRALVERAVAARQRAEPDTTLQSYHTTAHGFVFSLAQAGQDLTTPPRLIKADELEVEVYWQAPGTSKQVIRAWRDGRWLPTDVSYHRDHLGIVTDNFGDRIRIGEGDEVRDVVHPLAPEGPYLYDYRLVDSVRVVGRNATLFLLEVEVRPRDPAAPRVLGTLSLDATSADLVRFRFSFTPAAYLDTSLEDISVVLDNAQVEGRWWLPWRQEIEIRRRVSWFDFPARTIIRGRWEIGDYDLNVVVPPRVAHGPAIGGLRAPHDSAGAWPTPLAEAVSGVARPVEEQDLAEVRREVEQLAEGRLLSGLPRARLGVSSLSDIARVNRVQGLALGVGAAFRPATNLTFRPRAAFGTSDHRLLADAALEYERAGTRIGLTAGRRLVDLADQPLVSPLVNSLLSQEGGRDLGDYVLLDQARLAVTRLVAPDLALGATAALEHSHSVRTEAAPARGRYRPNPSLGVGTIGVGRLTLTWERGALARPASRLLRLELEGGRGDRDYARATIQGDFTTPAGPGAARLRLSAGAGTVELPGYRSFALGGWGTLLGEPFRAWGGRRSALAALEYRFEVPFPALPLGPFVSTGHRATLAPFLAAGWADGPVSGAPWQPTDGIRPVAGVALEWFQHLLRVDLGVGLRTGTFGISVDVGREWWEVL